jgi:hypothetical protein
MRRTARNPSRAAGGAQEIRGAIHSRRPGVCRLLLESAINLLDTTDDTQETTKTIRTGTTGDRNTKANELYEALLTI